MKKNWGSVGASTLAKEGLSPSRTVETGFGTLLDAWDNRELFNHFMDTEPHKSVASNSFSERTNELILEIDKLGKLPEHSPFHVSPKIADHVRATLAYLIYSYPVPEPRLSPEHSGCLSLTWDDGRMKTFLSFYEDAVDITRYSKALNVSCHEFVVDGDIADLNVDVLGAALSPTGEATSATGI